MSVSKKAKLEIAIWVEVWILESVATRSVQPSIIMSLLATGFLTAASAGLLSFVRVILSSLPKPFFMRVLKIIVVVFVLGSAAALIIRGLYAWLYPEVQPFGVALNIAVDTAWVAFHALLVESCLRRLKRRG